MMEVTCLEFVPFPCLIVKILSLLFCLNFINGNFVHLRVMGNCEFTLQEQPKPPLPSSF